MAKYWTASMQYSQLSVEELQRKAQESVKNAKNKGKEMHPIIVEGRQIAKSWWGMAWCKNIEQYADYASRIERGKRYVRSGAVVDLQIVKGKVKARVQGTRKTPYKVEINISPLKEEVCEDIIGKCSSQIQNLQELVNGQFPESLISIRKRTLPKPKRNQFQLQLPRLGLNVQARCCRTLRNWNQTRRKPILIL